MSKIIKLPRAELTGPKERRLLRAMVDQVPDNLFVKELDCRFVVANEAVLRIHGFNTPDEVIGKTDFDLHDAASAEKFFEIERSVINSGDSIIDMEELVVDAVTGKEKWLLTTKVAMRDDQGVVVGLVGISRDITARKKEDLLRDEQAVVVEMIAMNTPLEVVLNRLVRLIESQFEGVSGSILLLDETGHLMHGAAPSLPQEYSRAIGDDLHVELLSQ
nr:PAS domain-containing protein [Rhizobium leguminosarum]